MTHILLNLNTIPGIKLIELPYHIENKVLVRQDLVAVEDLHPVAVLAAWRLIQLQSDVCTVGRPLVVEAAQHRQQ